MPRIIKKCVQDSGYISFCSGISIFSISFFLIVHLIVHLSRSSKNKLNIIRVTLKTAVCFKRIIILFYFKNQL